MCNCICLSTRLCLHMMKSAAGAANGDAIYEYTQNTIDLTVVGNALTSGRAKDQ